MPHSLLFVTGYYKTVSDANLLQGYIRASWAKRGMAIDRFYRWDEDANIGIWLAAVPAGNKLGVIGFSFGAGAIIAALANLKRPVDQLIILDGVHPPSPTPTDPGWTLPACVKNATAWTRAAESRKAYWSVGIAHGACEWVNIKYNPTSATEEAQHGDEVWRPEPVNLMKSAIL